MTNFIQEHASSDDDAFLDALQCFRKKLIQTHKNQDYNDSSLSELYTDKAHFIFELLQNADDAQAEQVSFVLTDNILRVKHNGKKCFDRQDIYNITTVGKSPKAEDANAIGKFGMGFKSVFSVAKEPVIHSDNFHFRLKDRLVPCPLPAPDGWETAGSTEIILDLKEEQGLRDKIIEKLRSLDAQTLLFLKNIERVDWTIDEHVGFCKKEKKHLNNYQDGISLAEVTFCYGNEYSLQSTYFIFSREEIVAEVKCSLCVGYLLDEGEIIETKTETPLSVYFPLEKEKPGLSFLLHVPYNTSPDREKCDFTDSENRKLTEAVAQLVADTLPILRDRKMLTADFIKTILPWASDSHDVYCKIKSAVTNKFLSDSLLPATDNRFCTAGEVIFTDQHIPKIMDATIVVKSIKNEKYQNRISWLQSNIGNDAREVLRIPLYRLADLEANMENNFLNQLTDVNIMAFYRELWIDFDARKEKKKYERVSVHQERISIREKQLGKLSIIRLVNGDHLSALDSRNNRQVYLPSGKDDSRFPTVKSCLLNDDGAEKFLKDALKLTAPDDIAEVQKILSSYADNVGVSDAQHIKDIQKVLQVAEDKPDQVKEILADRSLVKCVSGDGIHCFHAVDKAYFYEQDISRFFDGYSGAFFVDEGFYDEYLQATDGVGGRWREMFFHFGVKENFGFTNNYSSELEFALSRIDSSEGNDEFQRSLSIWRLLQQAVQYASIYTRDNLRRTFGKYSWMYTKTEDRIPVTQIEEYALEDIHPEYGKVVGGEDERLALEKIASLKCDDVESLKKINTEQKEEIKELKDVEQKLKDELARIKGGAEAPALKPFGEIKPGALPSSQQRSRLSRPLAGGGVSRPAVSGVDEGSDGDAVAHQSGRKGLQAEKEFVKFLERKYNGYSIKWMNEQQNNRGYDFELTDQNGETIFIELKSFSTKRCPVTVELSKSQMEAARNYGKRFWLYVLYDCPDSPKEFKVENPGACGASPSRWKINIRERM